MRDGYGTGQEEMRARVRRRNEHSISTNEECLIRSELPRQIGLGIRDAVLDMLDSGNKLKVAETLIGQSYSVMNPGRSVSLCNVLDQPNQNLKSSTLVENSFALGNKSYKKDRASWSLDFDWSKYR